MLSFNSAISTARYWRSIATVQVENTRAVNKAARLAEMVSIRSDAPTLLKSLERDGLAVIPGYWAKADCSAARSEIERLMSEYPQAVRRFSGGSDNRMFGVEMVSDVLARFHADPFLKGMGEVLSGLELYNFSTLGARIDARGSNNGSGDGWHRDGFGFQYKSILYISDVTDENGPFEYLPGSHKPWRATTDTAIGNLPAAPQSRFEHKIIDRMVRRAHLPLRRYTAQEGTLLLVNTAGIHRGAPLRTGTRYALTNYFYHPYQLGESLIEKFEPLMPGVADRVRRRVASQALGEVDA